MELFNGISFLLVTSAIFCKVTLVTGQEEDVFVLRFSVILLSSETTTTPQPDGTTAGISTEGTITDDNYTSETTTTPQPDGTTAGISTEGTITDDNYTSTAAPDNDTIAFSILSGSLAEYVDDTVTLQFLEDTYRQESAELGFIGVEWDDTSVYDTKRYYTVSYDVLVFDGRYSDLNVAVNNAQNEIENSGENYGIDGVATAQEEENQPDAIAAEVLCGPYVAEHGCDDGFFSTAECIISEVTSFPECNCSTWGLYAESFYHGGKCHSIDAIIAFTVGGVSLILLVLSITICCLSCNVANLEDRLENMEDKDDDDYPFSKSETIPMTNPAYERNWSNPALAADAKQTEHRDSSSEDLDSRDQLHRGHMENGYSRQGSKQRNSDLYMPETDNMGRYNNGYFPEPGSPWDSKRAPAPLTESDAYKNFKANLSHIDPKANYGIKRPNVGIRPTDRMYNIDNDKDYEIPSFRI